MPRGKSSLASGESTTKAKRLSELEVQRDIVRHSDVSDETQDSETSAPSGGFGSIAGPEEAGEAMMTAAESAAPSEEQSQAVEASSESTEADDDTEGENEEAQPSGFVTELDSPRLSDEELGHPQQPLHPVELPTRRDYSLVTQALQIRQAQLETLAKKTDEGGYPREARVFKGDATAIAEHILPAFKAQRELALVQPAQLNFGIKNALRGLVHRAITIAAKAGDVRADVDSAENELMNQLAIRIGAFAREVSERSFNAGVAYRESEPDAIAEKALTALYTKSGN